MTQPKLVLLPYRYKAGTAYSVIPEDGSGDWTVDRNSIATRVNSDGLIEQVAADVIRIEYLNGICPVVLVEDEAENMFLHSNTFSNASWSKDALLIVTGGNISPTVAGNEGWEINDPSNTTFEGLRQVKTTSEDTITASVRIRKTTGTPPYYPFFDFLYLTGGSADNGGYFIFNTTTGDFALIDVVAPLTNPFLRATSLNSDWWIVEFGGTDTSGTQTQCQAGIYPAGSLNGTTLSSAAVGSQVVYGFQLEVGSESTSYIPTGATAVTRLADVITVTPPSGVTEITTTFEDNTTDIETTIPGTFTLPFGRIKSNVML